jgi:hypothetical protein
MTTTYCTYAELQNLTGSIDTSGNLTAIIEASDREINTYLLSRGITGSACDALKEASLKLSQAGLLAKGIQSGRYIAASGEMVNGPDLTASSITAAIKQLRDIAFSILDGYIATSEGETVGNVRVSRIRSRCC